MRCPSLFSNLQHVHILLLVIKEDIQALTPKLRTLTTSRGWSWREFLRDLWDKVVSHILDCFQTICLPQLRVWWYQTANFCHSTLLLCIGGLKERFRSLHFVLYYLDRPHSCQTFQFTRLCDSEETLHRHRSNGSQGARELCSVDTELDNIAHLVHARATFTSI